MIESILTGAVGKNVLITAENWFSAPDGQLYKAVFGKLVGVFTDYELLGVETNNYSTNWYVEVGNMVLAGCQVHYAIVTDTCDCNAPYKREEMVDGELKIINGLPRIWHAK